MTGWRYKICLYRDKRKCCKIVHICRSIKIQTLWSTQSQCNLFSSIAVSALFSDCSLASVLQVCVHILVQPRCYLLPLMNTQMHLTYTFFVCPSGIWTQFLQKFRVTCFCVFSIFDCTNFTTQFLPGWHKSPRILQPILSKTSFLGNSNVFAATNSAGFVEHYSDEEQSIKLTVEMKANQRRANNSCCSHCLKSAFSWTKNHSTDIPRVYLWSLCTDTNAVSVRHAISPDFLKFMSKTQQFDKNLYQHLLYSALGPVRYPLGFIKSYIFPGFRSSAILFPYFFFKKHI